MDTKIAIRCSIDGKVEYCHELYCEWCHKTIRDDIHADALAVWKSPSLKEGQHRTIPVVALHFECFGAYVGYKRTIGKWVGMRLLDMPKNEPVQLFVCQYPSVTEEAIV